VVLELRRSSSADHHFHGGKVRLLKRSSELGEDCSSGVLERTILEQLVPGKTMFPHVVRCDQIALLKILLLGEIQG
jgi:hypothetical protein